MVVFYLIILSLQQCGMLVTKRENIKKKKILVFDNIFLKWLIMKIYFRIYLTWVILKCLIMKIYLTWAVFINFRVDIKKL